MSIVTEWLDRKLYPSVSSNWDDELLRSKVLARLRPEMLVLDLGAGSGRVRQMNFRGLATRIVGVDPDPRVHSNPHLDQAIAGSGTGIPFPDSAFDMVISDNVLEHLDHPEAVIKEVFRVLKPGGWFFAKTPNKYHYMPVIARLTPTSFHRFVNGLRGRPPADTYPTLYRANTKSDVERFAESAGFDVESIALVEARPEYLRFSAVTYLIGALYERLVNCHTFFSMFRIVLLIELRKPARSEKTH